MKICIQDLTEMRPRGESILPLMVDRRWWSSEYRRRQCRSDCAIA